MKEIILHAGFHKTGSSSIQHTFSRLDAKGVAYLDWGHFNHSMPFLSAFTNGETAEMKGPAPDPLPADGQAALDRLKLGLLNASARRIILSAEAFSVAGYRPGLEALRDLLLRFADRIRVIAYVRPLDSLIPSDFQQCARAGLNVSFGRNADYLQRMQMLDGVFAAQNVEFHIFSPQTLLHGDVVRDFGARIGVNVPAGAVRRANEGVSLECVAVARCAALFGEVGVRDPINLELNYFATNQLQALGSTKFRVAGQVLADLTKPHVSELARVQQRIGGLFPPPKANSDGISSDEDLFKVAKECEAKLIETVRAFGTSGPQAAAIVAAGLAEAEKLKRPEIRAATLVDTIKRVRLAENSLRRAA